MKILIAEDDVNSRVFLERALLSQGYTVESAANGIQALEKSVLSPPDLIISDILMPQMDGFELCRRVKTDERLHTIPFVFYTATYTDKKDEDLALSLGAARFLIKPMEPEVFFRIIREVIDEYKAGHLSSPDRVLTDMAELDKMQIEALARKLDKKVRELEEEHKELQKVRDDWEDIFQAIGHPAIILDAEYNIISVNRAAIKAAGAGPAEELVGRKCHEIFHGAGGPPAGCPLQKMLSSSSFETTEVEVAIFGGLYLVSCTPIRDKKGGLQKIIHIATDITERKQTEEALRESEGKYRTLVENIPQKIFTKDSRSVYLSCNENYARDCGITPDEIAGKTDFDFFPKELAEKYRADDRRIMDSGKTEGIEEQYIQDGKKIWIYTVKTPIRDKAGNTIGILGVFSDITERKRAEEALQNSKTFLDNVIEQSPYATCIFDGKGMIVQMNQACRDLLHISDDDIIGKYNVLEDNIVREQGLMPLVKQVFEQGRSVRFNLEYDTAKLTHPALKDTTFVILDVTIFPIKDVNGKVTNGVIQHIDITERKRAEEEREKLHAQLLQSQKMEAVGLLAGGIAHDFNNILTAMIGYGHILKMKLAEEDPLRSYADHILSLSDKAANLTQNLLAFSRKQIINPRPVDLNNIIRKLDHWLSRIIPEDIRLQTTLSEKDLIAMVDSGQIEQVLMNLATNARDAMPEGGLLTIRTELVDIDPDFIKEHGFGREGPYALITLTDTGAGMDREIREKIFEPFFTTKEVGKGTGLGLAMVYGIIKQHEGNVNVYSEPGRGTTFRIYLPLIGGPAEEMERDEMIPPDAAGTETLLLAEDETEVRNFTRNLLEEYGYTIITAADGQDAVHQFVAHKSEIQLVLLDVIMPLKNGREVYDEINRIRPGLKVLFMSGYPADVIHRQGILDKGFEYIEKPASPAQLLRKIRKILDA